MFKSIVGSIKIALASLALSIGLAGGLALPVAAQAAGDAANDVCAGINVGGGSCQDNGEGLTRVIRLVVQILSIIAGIAAVIMIVVAGLRFITSGGDASKVSGAKSAIVYAIVGLIVVALSQIIVRYVLKRAA